MDLDEAYADADTIAKHQDTLQTQMADYGYEIIKALITNIEPDQRVKAMNNINAARRNQEAATAQGEGDKTLRIKKTEAESASVLAGLGRIPDGPDPTGDAHGQPRRRRGEERR